MKKIIYIPLLLLLLSCNKGKRSYEDKVSIEELKTELISKFGKDAYYTKLSITNKDYGSFVSVSQTDEPSSLKMTDWNYSKGSWKQTSDVTLELFQGAKAVDFMFQLDKIVDFDLIGKVVEESKKKIIEEKGISEVRVENIIIKAPNDGNFNNMKYYITISPKSGGTDFEFWYKIDGTLDHFDY
ncbi:hypothetical protein [Flagellimonas onchidii]|uniref:hypothetical protein n=1 Tax=Flagellimonas onchidii TaxID=2562684 RepID=UPI0010A639AE|nr:hypothetical protein [Allomuricauda onchidii]